MEQTKEPVRLRRRTRANGRQALYLDIYLKGRRANEYLGLFLVPERTREDRDANRQTLSLAEAIKAKRLVEIRNGQYGFKQEDNSNALFLPFFDAVAKEKPSRKLRWPSCRLHIVEYACGHELRIKDIDREWVEGFKKYLDSATNLDHKDCRDYQRSTLSLGTKGSYFGILKTCLKVASDRGLIAKNPADGVKGFRMADPKRVYLTMEEVKALDGTECRYPVLKRAFLFSCLTGLRKSDIDKLTWSEVEQNGEFTRLVFRQKKTGGLEYLDISPQAVEYMGMRGKPQERVFSGFYFTTAMGKHLREWAQSAGIDKHITFHSGRHTFAVIMLDLGADIYTVQKLLGHRELKTTQVYADLLDKKKQAAVSLIPKF
jgi:hypothetical protein